VPRLIPPILVPGSISSREQPVIGINDELLLRPWTLNDASVVVAGYGDPDIQRWMPYSYDQDEAVDVIRRWNDDWRHESGACWAIAQRSGDTAIGRIPLQDIDLISGSAELAYWVLPDFRGSGVASLALTALSDWAFDELELHRLDLNHSVENLASCLVAVRAQFDLEGTARSAGIYVDGWHDVHRHGRFS
jgi:[ribosomal protein S5]-alanine N-acetyltransferase